MRLKVICLFVIAIVSACESNVSLPDPNDSYFIKFYGTDGDQTGDDLVILPDGGIILFGSSKPTGSEKTSQWYLLKTDPKGNVIWERRYGGPNNDQARDVELTNDNRLVLVGNTQQSVGNRDIKIMTVTLDGVPIDSAVMPIFSSPGVDALGDEDAASVTQTSDGFIVAGSTTYVTSSAVTGYTDPRDALTMRFNNNLTNYTLGGWPAKHSYGYYSDDISRKIYEQPDGTFYVFGYSNAPARNQTVKNYNFWYFQLSASAGTLPSNLLGVQTEDEKMTSAITIPLESGDGYIMAGVTTGTSTGTTDLNVARVKKVFGFDPPPPPGQPAVLDEFYQKSFSINLGVTTEQTAVFATRSNSFYLLANENSAGSNQNWILTKGNILDGTAVWKLPIVFGGEGLDACGSVQEYLDGRVLIVGTMRTGKSDAGEFKMTLVKVNPDGKLAK